MHTGTPASCKEQDTGGQRRTPPHQKPLLSSSELEVISGVNGLVSQRQSKIYYCTFEFQGREIWRSTVVTNRKDALTVQAHIRSELALRRCGILDEHRAPARPHPERIPQRTLHHGRDQAQTRKYYEFGIEKLLDSDLASRTLRSITRQDCHRSMAQHVRPAEHHDPDRRHRHLDHDRYAPSTVNCVLQTLGRALRIAQETGFLQKVRVIELARKERRRE
jgi:hypothetical protein